MSEPSSPTAAGVLFPELADTPGPAPPARSRGSRVLRMAARVVLWGLIAAGAGHGLLPAAEPPDPTSAAHPADRRVEAVAAAFLREYLTVGDDPAARDRRLGQFTVVGTELQGTVSVPAGIAQYVDLVVVAGSSPVAGGIDVTVLAHVLQVRSGAYRYRDGGILAFVVPLAVLPSGVVVRGRPRPTVPPMASGMSGTRPRATPPALSRPAGRVARRAVAAFVVADGRTLARLGGGRPPAAHPLPAGWHATGVVGGADVTGNRGALAAQVTVRMRPPTGQASYVVPIRVDLEAGPGGLTVRRINAGGPP